MCKRKARHVCRRDRESGVRGWMWPVLIKSPGRWRWREVLRWLKRWFRTNNTISCLWYKGWLWRRKVIIPFKTPTWRGEEKKGSHLQCCKATYSSAIFKSKPLKDCISSKQNLQLFSSKPGGSQRFVYLCLVVPQDTLHASIYKKNSITSQVSTVSNSSS